jgi:RHS repeat-associated protein
MQSRCRSRHRAQVERLGLLAVAVLLLLAPRALSPTSAFAAFTDESSPNLPSDAGDSYAIASGDVDGDGDEDLVVANGGQTALLLNDGSGFFSDASSLQLPAIDADVLGVALGDVDGDTHLDLFLVNALGPDLLLINDSFGSFSDESGARLPGVDGASTDVMLVDLNQDEAPDAVVAVRGGANRLLLNDGSGVYDTAPPGSLPADADRTQAIALADANGDGARDLFFANDRGQNRLLLNDGLGVFTNVTDAALPAAADETLDAEFADVDDDGDSDLILANGAAGVELLLNDGGRFAPAPAAAVPPLSDYAIAVTVGDIDFDGSPDLVVAATGQDHILLNDGGGAFGDATASELPTEEGRSFGLVLVDVESDFDLDLALAVPQGGNRLLLNRLEIPRIRMSVSPSFVVVGDDVTIEVEVFDEDGVVSTLLEVDGTPVPLDVDGVGIFVPTVEGPHVAEVTAEDTLGNVATRFVGFDVSPPDLTAPLVTLSIDAPPPLLVGQSVTIQATATDAGSGVADVSVTVNGAPLPLDVTGTGVFATTAAGLHTVVATATDFAGTSVDATDSFDVLPDPDSPVVTLSASPDPVDLASPVSIGVSATDNVAVVSLTLSVSGPGIVGEQDVPIGPGGQASFTPFLPGTFTLTARALDPAGNEGVASVGFEAVGVADTTPPEVTLSVVPGALAIGGSVAIAVTATDDVQVASTELSINGTPVPLGASGVVNFTPPVIGSYTAVARAFDPTGNQASAQQTFNAIDPATDTSPPVVSLSTPDDLAEVTWLTDVVGTATDLSLTQWTLSYAPADSNSFVPIASGNASVQDDFLGRFDPTLLANGLYQVRLSAVDLNGRTAATEHSVRVAGEAKVGNFRISLQDLAIPVAGIPITVVRSYDSRVKTRENFGVGWTLDVLRGEVTHNRTPGRGWEIVASGGLLGIPCQVVNETSSHLTEVRLSDREFYEFRLVIVNPTLGSGCPATAQFQFVNGSTPGASLEILGNTGVLYLGGNEVVDDFTFETYDPRQVRLTTPDGRVVDFDLDAGGISQIRDPNGNTLTVGPGGIIHSSGTSIVFTRDAQGRITRITDPLGNALEYEYDTNGDLVFFTDQEDDVTEYRYNAQHGLTEIIDPNGEMPARNVYDDDGRLVAVIDSEGHRTEFTHDLSGRSEVVRDPLGNATIYVYDESGNVLSETDPLGDTTTFTYDADGNQTSETDPLGNTSSYTYDARGNRLSSTDPLGHTIQRTYNDRNQVLTQTDALGNTRTRSYDGSGNLVATTDALGSTTTYTHDPSGNVLTVTDPEGNVTSFSYDAHGNVTQKTEPPGAAITFTYDANGNELTRTTTRTDELGNLVAMTTTHLYDAKNQLIATTGPDGNTVETEYGPLGRESALVDALGNRTELEYDARGHVVATRYPDGTTELTSYDGQGRESSVNVLTRTDPAGHVTSFSYDAMRRVVTTTGANGNTTSFEYDAAGRTTRTVFPDGTSASASYDRLGRRRAVSDQAGLTTSFEYDGPGTRRLTKVVDALGGETTFAYDEVGNRVGQADAEGKTTAWAYDDFGRVVRRELPLGMAETLAYDADGNLLARTDFNGVVTNFEYDAEGRVVRRIYPDRSEVAYTYLPTGQIETVADDRGVTSYGYEAGVGVELADDGVGIADSVERVEYRLTSVTHPDGTTLGYAYDLAGNRVSFTDPSGATTYAYDALNRLSAVTTPDGETTAYTYDAVGNRASQTAPNGVVTSYAYDALNRLVSLTNEGPGGALISGYSYTLGPAGKRVRVEEAGSATMGRIVDYTYDGLDRLVEERIDGPGTEDERTLRYAYDTVGNRLSREVVVGPRTATTLYSYDANDRLLEESTATVLARAPPAGGTDLLLASSAAALSGDGSARLRDLAVAPPASEAADYGTPLYLTLSLAALIFGLGEASYRLAVARGRRTRWLRLRTAAMRTLSLLLIVGVGFQPHVVRALMVGAYPGEAAVSAAPGEVVPAETLAYSYDANGNTLSRSDGVATDTYSYDFENRLVSADIELGPAPGFVSYAYDADGIRVSQTAGGITTDYVVDKNRPFAQIVLEQTGADATSYAHGDDLIRQTGPSGATSYYLYDGNVSVRQLSDDVGAVTDTYTYDAFGVPLATSGSTPNHFLYAGERFETDLGLYYLRARYYSPAAGRFLTADPFQGRIFDPPTLHKYTYTQNDPVNRIDPSGEESLLTIMLAVVIVGILAGLALPAHAGTGPPRPTIYVEFIGNKNEYPHWAGDAGEIKKHVLERVKKDFGVFSEWPLEVTDKPPSMGAFKTVKVGGVNADADRRGIFGSAHRFCNDVGNVYTWSMLVQAYQGDPGSASDPNRPRIPPVRSLRKIKNFVANVTSHELGHQFGLEHVGTRHIMKKGFKFDVRTWSRESKRTFGTRCGP